MSTTDGESPGQLNAALENLFAGKPTLPEPDPHAPPAGPNRRDQVLPPPSSTRSTVDGWSVDDPDDEPYTLPAIVPATKAPVVDDRISETERATPVAQSAPVLTGPPRQTAPATAWGDHMSMLSASAQGSTLRAPGRRPRVRRVTRVLRHIDPWSTFKVSLLFSVVAYLVSLTAGVLLWRVADSTGTLANVERWFTQFGWETFELKGGEVFHNAWIIGLFGAVGLTGGLVLLATLFNLVSDIVGGVRMTVLEEEVVERTVSSARRYVVRRGPSAAAGADGHDDWDIDDGTDADARESGTAAVPVFASDDPSPNDAATSVEDR
ncbi:MAG: DUF3566 domain-containing protein [Ilumatobacter sp.]